MGFLETPGTTCKWPNGCGPPREEDEGEDEVVGGHFVPPGSPADGAAGGTVGIRRWDPCDIAEWKMVGRMMVVQGGIVSAQGNPMRRVSAGRSCSTIRARSQDEERSSAVVHPIAPCHPPTSLCLGPKRRLGQAPHLWVYCASHEALYMPTTPNVIAKAGAPGCILQL